MFRSKTEMVSPEKALPGRSESMPKSDPHFVNGTSIHPPFPENTEQAIFGMGCFWGAERIFWQIPGVHTTAVGYAGGYTPNPTYEEALHRPDRAHRSGARRVRPRAGHL